MPAMSYSEAIEAAKTLVEEHYSVVVLPKDIPQLVKGSYLYSGGIKTDFNKKYEELLKEVTVLYEDSEYVVGLYYGGMSVRGEERNRWLSYGFRWVTNSYSGPSIGKDCVEDHDPVPYTKSISHLVN